MSVNISRMHIYVKRSGNVDLFTRASGLQFFLKDPVSVSKYAGLCIYINPESLIAKFIPISVSY